MANLTNAKIANTFKDLLQVNAATSNSGIDDTVRQVQDGGGTAGPFGISNSRLDVTGQFALNGTVLTATASQINDLVLGSGITALTTEDDTVLITRGGVSVSTATASATVKVNPSLSISSVIASTGSFLTKVSGAAAEFSGDVSANNVYATTNIFIGGAAIPTGESVASVSSRITSVGTVLAATSAALATSISNVSAAMATSIGTTNTRIAQTSTDLATSIGTTNTRIAQTSTDLAASIGTTNTRIAQTSTDLATSIGTTNTRIAQTSTDLATSIGTRLPLAGGTLTGILSGTDVYVSALAVGTNDLLGKDIHIEKSAVADIQALTDGTNISIDFNVGQNFTVTLAGNRTLDNPTNCVAGQVGSIFVVQDGTGSRTLAYGGNWDFTAGTAPTLSTDADAIDRLDYIVHTSTDVQAVLTKAYS